jgi:hypothetical protein
MKVSKQVTSGDEPMAQEQVLTKHPLGKSNKPVDKADYETFKAAILSALRRKAEGSPPRNSV